MTRLTTWTAFGSDAPCAYRIRHWPTYNTVSITQDAACWRWEYGPASSAGDPVAFSYEGVNYTLRWEGGSCSYIDDPTPDPGFEGF